MGDLVIEKCLPSARAAEIQGLFERAGQQGFPTVFERVYLVRERTGLRSWIALQDGRAVLHISVALQPFTGAARPMTAGLMGDLMADPDHRDFWGPIKLARRMVGDVKKDAAIDFLVTSYVPAAEGVFRAAGFKPFSNLRRHVMPVLWPYRTLRRMLVKGRPPRVTAIPFVDARMDEFLPGLGSPGYFRPTPNAEYFSTRMPRMAWPAGTWLLAGSPKSPDAAVLMSPMPNGEVTIANVLWRGSDEVLEPLLLSVAGWAAAAGHRNVSLTTMEDSRLSTAAQGAGFLTRREPLPIMVLPLCAPGDLPSPKLWTFTPFMLTAW